MKQIPVDAQVMPFIFERHQACLSQLQDEYGVKLSWEEGSNNITLVPVDKTSAEKDRFDDACKAVASFFHGFLEKLRVLRQTLGKMLLDNSKTVAVPRKIK